MAERGLGVELGAALLKVVLLERTRDGDEVVAAAVRETPAGAIVGGRVLQPEAVSESLRELLKSAQVTHKKCFLALGKQSVILRTVQLPVMPERELREAVRWEAEKHLQFPLEEAVVDYTGVREIKSEDGNKLELYLAAVQKEVVHGYLEAAAAAGLNPVAVDVETFALFRLLLYLGGPAAENDARHASLLLDAGEEASGILIAEGGRLVFQRVVSLSQEADPGDLSREVQRSVDYYFYNSRERESQLRQVWLVGAGSKRGPLLERLRDDLEIEPQVLNPFMSMKIQKKSVNLELNDAAPHLAVACGLALRGWRHGS
ncbi:MAG: type IV pilus assembly protein PilM [Firmicutes bacterium]|nr:type IV pilus assembly protein PilM [Bacillota bacterium]